MKKISLFYPIIFGLALLGCLGAGQPFTGSLPGGTELNMSGTFMLAQSGELLLALDKPCMMSVNMSDGEATSVKGVCDASSRDGISVIAMAPWSEKIQGIWIDAAHLRFPVEWKHSQIDPLAADALAVATRPWYVSGAQWTPTRDDASRILQLVSGSQKAEKAEKAEKAKRAEKTEELHQGGEAPKLEVVGFDVVGGTLRAGQESTLVLRIVNHGRGTAYRVAATTRSIIHALHGQQLSFGTIDPGSEVARQLRVSVPATETASDTMLVAVISEGNGFAPPNASRRVPISLAKPALSVQCSAGSGTATPVEVDSGQPITLHCVVKNTGPVAAKVELETSFPGTQPSRFPARDVAADAHVPIDVPIVIPGDWPIGSTAKLSVTAQDRQFARSASAAVVDFVVRKPRLCVPGQLIEVQYHAKLRDLRAELAAGHLTQAQLDRYDAELVACLK